jgi:hypothetical protein
VAGAARERRSGPAWLSELITLRQAATELPRRRAGRKTAVQTVYRWSNPPGCRGVVLRTVQAGSVRCTTRQWLAEFIEALTAARSGERVPHRTPSARRRATEGVDRELDRLGV